MYEALSHARLPATCPLCKHQEHLHQSAAGPSEVARKYYGEESWRDQMETVRRAARRLVSSAQIEITQKGKPVNPSTAKGPIRLRMA